MKKAILMLATVVALSPGLCRGQAVGNLGYGQSGARARAEQREQAMRRMADADRPPSGTATFVEADVLMNVKADEFVAVFGLSQEGKTVEECGRRMDALTTGFVDALGKIGIPRDDLFLDFVAQAKTYGFEISGDVAREVLVGFELKKNLAIRYRDRDLLDKIVVAAAGARVDDLIKVDYVVRDVRAIQDRLMEEAAKVVKRKRSRYESLLGITLQPPAQVFAERYSTFYPTQMYDSFTAAEAEGIAGVPDRQKYTIQSARKGRTFVFNGLDADGFDEVINPVLLEPMVQFTLHLKIKYEVEQPKAK